jgi:leader peptidase (prepilin peptidase)/N-methyltransferase
VATLYLKLKKIEGMGGGDVKLLAMIGAWLGLKSILGVLLLGSILGVLVGLPVMLVKRDRYYQLPFGPFLAFGAVVYLFFDMDQILYLVWKAF